VAAQDDPLDELARSGVGDCGLDIEGLLGATVVQGLDCPLDQRDVRIGRLGQRSRPFLRRIALTGIR